MTEIGTPATTAAASADGQGASTSSAKPRARLGPTEIVTIPNDSDSEPDEEVDGQADGEGGEGVSEDFLKDYPDDSEVCCVRPCSRDESARRLMRQDLQLQHLRLKNTSLPPLRLERFGSSLRRLCLRQNELSSPLPDGTFAGLSELQELDMYDNRLGPDVMDDELKGLGNLTCVSSPPFVTPPMVR